MSASQCVALWRMNQRASPAALQLSESDFADLIRSCDVVLQEREKSSVLAFALGMSAAQPQANFAQQWFLTRFEDFLFLERMVVAPASRRRGVGRKLLENLVRQCQAAGLRAMCCQIHDRPRNAEAHAFALACGFQPIESVMLPSRDIVTMYQRSIATATP